jgi:hypothetical protein
MIPKQLMIDIVVVLSVPVVIIGGYMMWFRDESGPLLSASSEMLQTRPTDPGALTRVALQKLNSISLDASLFRDPAFLALQTYTVPIPEAKLEREYPFTPTPEIAEMLKRAKASVSAKGNTAPAKAESISTKLDLLKSTTAR